MRVDTLDRSTAILDNSKVPSHVDMFYQEQYTGDLYLIEKWRGGRKIHYISQYLCTT